ncbi:MAG: hypothetical protein QOI11_1376 [Candidatus Eremiobacteraeota bacterium]|nr:hypothetical protein [Candidatus Eremiobacteraeota bacterium]
MAEAAPHAGSKCVPSWLALLAEIKVSRAEFDAGNSVPLTRELLGSIADGARKRSGDESVNV